MTGTYVPCVGDRVRNRWGAGTVVHVYPPEPTCPLTLRVEYDDPQTAGAYAWAGFPHQVEPLAAQPEGGEPRG
jgi:hypothetical protein